MGRARLEHVKEADADVALVAEYVYDADGDLSEVISPAGLHVKYERDPVTKDVTEVRNVGTGTKYASNVKHLPSGPITDLTFAGGATLSQGFNLRYEPIAIVSGKLGATTPVLELSYTVSGAGLMMDVGRMSFTYDRRGRLETVTPLSSTPYSFVYPHDAAAPPWFAVNDRPQEAQDLGGKRVYAFGYDDGSSLSAISRYDAGGAAITTTTCLVHDALGRLTAVGPAKVVAGPDARACNSESDLASVTVRFRYDARNRRVARQDGTGPWKQYVFTPGGVPLAELTKPSTASGAWGLLREYVWLDGRPLAQIEYPGPGNGSEGYVYLVHVDHLGQPRALTTRSNTVVWAASPPRPYGDIDEVTVPDPSTGRTIVTNLRLPGQYDERLLASIGLKGPFYNGQRWYLPQLARYMELDPIALRGGLNGLHAPDWYGYGNANPMRWTDPTGEDAVGAVIGVGMGMIYGYLGAKATGGNVVVGTIIGGVTGLITGAVDPTFGLMTAVRIGGFSGFGGSLFGSLAMGSPTVPAVVGAAGAGVGGAISGAFGWTIATSVGTGVAPTLLGAAVGGEAAFISEIAAGEIGQRLDSSDPNIKPWQDTGTRADWLRAAGCKQ